LFLLVFSQLIQHPEI